MAAIVFLVVLAANAQSCKAAPAPPQMSHDFRIAGRRAVNAIGDLDQACSSGTPSGVPVCDVAGLITLVGKAFEAIKQAEVQRDNAADQEAVKLLKEYTLATYDVALGRAQITAKLRRSAWCKAGACDLMYATCKKEAEEAFETGLLPARSQCKSLSARDSKE